MEHKKSGNEFEATIDSDGRIVVPENIAKQFAGRRVHVRLSSEEIAASMKGRGVSESEIEEIMRVQLEARDQVVKFLMTEGVLARDKSFGRAPKAKR